MLSYCQDKLDLKLWEYSFDIPEKIIDIGASDGISNSNSRIFFEYGWDAILIEPQPDKFRELEEHAPSNAICLNLAISETTGEVDFLYNPRVEDHSRIPNNNYYSEKYGKTPVREMKVLSWSLDTLFNEFPFFKDLGILCIDTEGYDEYILAELMKTDVRPHVILCEHHTEDIQNRQKAILENEYDFREKVSCNSIYTIK